MLEIKSLSDLLGPLMLYSWGYLLLSFSVTSSGVVIHYIKKCIRLEADWDTYWIKHKAQTFTALTAAFSSYISILMTNTEASLVTFFAIGYVVDSMFNKAPASKKVAAS